MQDSMVFQMNFIVTHDMGKQGWGTRRRNWDNNRSKRIEAGDVGDENYKWLVHGELRGIGNVGWGHMTESLES